MTTILIGLPDGILQAEQIARIHALAPGARLVVTDRREKMEAVLDDVEIAAGLVSARLIVQAPRLRWYQQWAAGADWLLRCPEAVEQSFTLTSTSGIHATVISEHVLAFLLALSRRLDVAVRAQSRHEWVSYPWGVGAAPELAGQTLLLVGVGAIGRCTAQVASALGMRVLGVRRNPERAVAGIERLVGPAQLAEVLPLADWVVILLPLTQATRGSFGERELRRMKPSAYLVNVGRGGTLDEMALLRALRKKWIAGAGLDVFEQEPLPPDSPFWDMPNVIITGHYAGSMPGYHQRALGVFLDNLQRYQTGQPLRNVVDKRRGY